MGGQMPHPAEDHIAGAADQVSNGVFSHGFLSLDLTPFGKYLGKSSKFPT
jgi:hypothetical protein